MDKSIRPPPRKERSRPDAIPYTKNAFERDLERVHDAWDDSQTDRRRDAIYGYLKAVYDLVNWWLVEFVKRKGGINECNARYGRCLRRLAARKRSIETFRRRSASERTVSVRRVRP
jgi:hypothetical protein